MTSATAPESVKRYYCTDDCAMGDLADIDHREYPVFVAEADHDRFVAALAARLASVEKVLHEISEQRRHDEDGIMHRMPCAADLAEHARSALLAMVGET
jgi:hypothetical protein